MSGKEGFDLAYYLGLCKHRRAPLPVASEVQHSKNFINEHYTPIKTLNRHYGSYQFKHFVEHWLRQNGIKESYVSQASFVQAAYELGYEVKQVEQSLMSCRFNFGFKNPTHRGDWFEHSQKYSRG